MGAWNFGVLSAGKTPYHKIRRFGGEGVLDRGKSQFYFYGRRREISDFLTILEFFFRPVRTLSKVSKIVVDTS